MEQKHIVKLGNLDQSGQIGQFQEKGNSFLNFLSKIQEIQIRLVLEHVQMMIISLICQDGHLCQLATMVLMELYMLRRLFITQIPYVCQ